MDPMLLRLLVIVIGGIVVQAIVIGFLYLRFRDGLATRIFALIGPSYLLVLIIVRASATMNNLYLSIASAAVGVPILVIILWQLYKSVVGRLNRYSTALLSAATQLAATAKQTAAISAEQAATVAEVGTTVEEIAQTSAATAMTAQKVLRTASDAVTKGHGTVEASTRAMSVMEAVGKVTEIVDLVNELAEQSNLLAVNAGIEAAKAGEHGRGFAVVASEVRNLAEQSKSATQQIRRALAQVEDGRRAIATVGHASKDILAMLEESADNARQISGAASQQASGIKQISAAMANVDQGGRDTAATAAQLESAVHALESLSKELKTYVLGSHRA
jgi:methyl-accepting chemotaxis protein